MTGEPDPIEKGVPTWIQGDTSNPFMISSTKVVRGYGKMVVLAVGRNTERGKIKCCIRQHE